MATTDKQKMNTAIFLGAGASAAEGAPIQTNLFKDYFHLIRNRSGLATPQHERELATFFALMFDIDVDNSDLENVLFPTFEEALGMLDLADLKNESFRDFTNINFASNSGQIKFLRLYLVYLMADIIDHSLRQSKNIHRKLIRELKSNGDLDSTIFLTTNYDILCDNALQDLYPENKPDYGVDFVNKREETLNLPDLKGIKLFKLHGSLNWLYCPTCNNLRITHYEKGVYKLMVDPAVARCHKCLTVYSPIIVPPTFYKDLSKVFLSQVWNRAENELSEVDHLIFCGYSFPDADIHIKYLIKRIQKNRRNPQSLKITVINNHEGKKQETKDEERLRFQRFLGHNVDYTDYGFEEFADNPKIVM
ncbi:MAG: SIR2 family protein [Chitinophagaceae bacterium]|jgi:NAD-dependent SIR2 family protein deacetylase